MLGLVLSMYLLVQPHYSSMWLINLREFRKAGGFWERPGEERQTGAESSETS